MTDPIIGGDDYRYRFERNWAKPPRWWNFGNPNLPGPPRTSVKGAAAANGDIYVLSRSAHPVMVFDAEGQFVTSWGENEFSNFVHGLTIDPAGKVWITDTGLHTVTQHEPDGTLLRTLGVSGVAMPTLYGSPFNMPTGVAFTSTGDFFVSDGYGNRRVHCFSAGGELKHSWGEPGTGPGQFALVHFITADSNDQLYVCDRENHRIQIFDDRGRYQAQWNNLHRPCGMFADRRQNDLFYVGELGTDLPVSEHVPNLGPRVSMLSARGDLVGRFGGKFRGEEPGEFTAPHGCSVDSRGDLYVAEVAYTSRGSKEHPPREIRSLQKFTRAS